ncbi:hypothetical protein C8Q80DRAFT_6594 [Daedaleopsis nitida]|nr:hypothetical protein C8Q80DRAFT_6594 [Daedaleopsis nitida]
MYDSNAHSEYFSCIASHPCMYTVPPRSSPASFWHQGVLPAAFAFAPLLYSFLLLSALPLHVYGHVHVLPSLPPSHRLLHGPGDARTHVFYSARTAATGDDTDTYAHPPASPATHILNPAEPEPEPDPESDRELVPLVVPNPMRWTEPKYRLRRPFPFPFPFPARVHGLTMFYTNLPRPSLELPPPPHTHAHTHTCHIPPPRDDCHIPNANRRMLDPYADPEAVLVLYSL